MADPGFPVGGGADPLGGGHRPLMCTLFGKNVCENERNGSCWGGGAPAAPPPPGSANVTGVVNNTIAISDTSMTFIPMLFVQLVNFLKLSRSFFVKKKLDDLISTI